MDEIGVVSILDEMEWIATKRYLRNHEYTFHVSNSYSIHESNSYAVNIYFSAIIAIK